LATGYNYLYIWDLASGKLEHKLEGGGYIDGAAWMADGKTVAGSCPQYLEMRLWDVPSGKLQRTIKTKEYAHTVAFLPGGKNLFYSGNRYDIIDEKKAFKFWATGSGPLPFKREEAFKIIGTLTVRDLMSWQPVRTINLLEFSIDATALSADGKTLALAGHITLGKEIRKAMVYDLATGTLLYSYAEPKAMKLLWKYSGVALSADGTRLAFIGDGNAVKLWTLPILK
jgi:WD40 repeat protein